jgi:glyoxylase-like metal-dependent hydrolase (beta-lactamase superfamily II)
VGRTDIPGANPRSLKASLKQLVHSFPEYSIIPGHGPASTMIEEIRDNYFLKEYRG